MSPTSSYSQLTLHFHLEATEIEMLEGPYKFKFMSAVASGVRQ